MNGCPCILNAGVYGEVEMLIVLIFRNSALTSSANNVATADYFSLTDINRCQMLINGVNSNSTNIVT